MIPGLADAIYELFICYDLCRVDLGLVANDLWSAGVYLQSGNTFSAGGMLKQAHNDLDVFNYDLTSTDYGVCSNTLLAFTLIDDAEFGVDMSSILSAMLGATFEEIKYFVGYEEAYKIALWDEWYNYEFYAALGRGFKELAP